MKVLIVGGGSAGWMSAATLIHFFPKYDVTVVESPNIPSVGVGESTISGFIEWLELLDIVPENVIKFCNGTFKLGIHFQNFYKEKDDGFFYPFGPSQVSTLNTFLWHLAPGGSLYADAMFANMSLIRRNKFKKLSADGYALHFDATKFAEYLKTKFCVSKGVKHVKKEIVSVEGSVDCVVCDDGTRLSADLYLDCSGFRSLLLGKTLQEPFVSYERNIPNNMAWATHIPYVHKEKECVPYTNCTALKNGWVWNIPLWNSVGTGYVYSNEFISDEEALEEFKTHLSVDTTQLSFRKIPIKSGHYERSWVNNVVAIGLAGGFIEPLESSGLWTVYNTLLYLVRILDRGSFNEWDKNVFNATIKTEFKQWFDFVALHYALSTRRDSKYWEKISKNSFEPHLFDEFSGTSSFATAACGRLYKSDFINFKNFTCIALGMNWSCIDRTILKTYSFKCGGVIPEQWQKAIQGLRDMQKKWDEEADKAHTVIDYLESIHD